VTAEWHSGPPLVAALDRPATTPLASQSILVLAVGDVHPVMTGRKETGNYAAAIQRLSIDTAKTRPLGRVRSLNVFVAQCLPAPIDNMCGEVADCLRSPHAVSELAYLQQNCIADCTSDWLRQWTSIVRSVEVRHCHQQSPLLWLRKNM
jgi:hypothetical protein